MLEALKSRISGLLQILNKTDMYYRTDIQRFKWPSNIQHQNPNNQLKYQFRYRLTKPQQHSYYILKEQTKRYE